MAQQTIHEKLTELAGNLWWSWQPGSHADFSRDRSVRCGRNWLITRCCCCEEYPPDKLEARAREVVLHSRINWAYRRWQEYMESPETWGPRACRSLGHRPVAYFSAEFGVHESLPSYSGGLGVLAGDHLKSASDLGIPLVAVGLFYHEGYFSQYIDEKGWQQEVVHRRCESGDAAAARRGCRADEPVVISVDTRHGEIFAQVWQLDVGRVPAVPARHQHRSQQRTKTAS